MEGWKTKQRGDRGKEIGQEQVGKRRTRLWNGWREKGKGAKSERTERKR